MIYKVIIVMDTLMLVLPIKKQMKVIKNRVKNINHFYSSSIDRMKILERLN